MVLIHIHLWQQVCGCVLHGGWYQEHEKFAAVLKAHFQLCPLQNHMDLIVWMNRAKIKKKDERVVASAESSFSWPRDYM